MTREISKDEDKTPSKPQSTQKSTSYMGYLFQGLSYLGVSTENTEANKVIQVKSRLEEVKKFEEESSKQTKLSQQARFSHNRKIIMGLEKEHGISYLTIERDSEGVPTGKLLVASNKVGVDEDAIQLILQTQREAWGKLIEAEHGFKVKEVEIQNLNQLLEHIRDVCPEALLKAKEGDPHPLKILTKGYRKEEAEIRKLLEEASPGLEEKQHVQEVLEKQKLETEKKTNEIRNKTLGIKSLEKEEKGANPAEFVTDITQSTPKKVVVKKSDEDTIYGRHLARMMNLDPFGPEAKKFAKIAGFNESLISHLNILFGGRLRVPMASKTEEKTLHAAINTIGNYYDIRENNPDVLKAMPKKESQEFVFSQLISYNTDCHGGNILFDKQNRPNGIDFGRILPPCPEHRGGFLSGAYLHFPYLDAPINDEDKKFYLELDVEKTVAQTEELLRSEHKDKFSDPEIAPLLYKSLDVLRARLYLVKQCLQEGLTQRQILALDFPPFSDQEMDLLLDGMEKLQEQEYTPVLRERLTNILMKQGFRKAWLAANIDPTFNPTIFQKVLQKEIEKVKQLPKDLLYGENEELIYQNASMDTH